MALEETDVTRPSLKEPALMCRVTDTKYRSRKQQANDVQNVRIEGCVGKIALPMEG